MAVSWRLILKKPKARPRAVLQALHSKLEVIVTVEGTDVPADKGVLKFNRRYLRLVEGRPTVGFPAGTFRSRASWTLEAVKEVGNTWVQFSVGRPSSQLVGFNVRIPGLKRVK
jgi:hypothetical protein